MTLDLTSQGEYLELYRWLSELLYRYDPIGLAVAGAPKDEYEPEVGTIIPRLRDVTSQDDVCRVIHEEFVRWFGEGTAGPGLAYKEIADDIWNRLTR